jgi:hypothetical protein
MFVTGPFVTQWLFPLCQKGIAMDRRAFVTLLLPALALLGCSSAPSQQAGSDSGPRFSGNERELITRYFASERGKGSTVQKPAQRVKPGDLLDSGQRPNKLPTGLDQQLSTLASPYTRLTLGADVILVNRDTHVIADVIPQVAY